MEVSGAVGSYTIGERIGEGGFATVHRATTARGEEVAIKILGRAAGEDAEARRRFEREVATLARVSHPNLVALLDHGIDPGHGPYLVMPLLVGLSLRSLIPPDGFGPEAALRFLSPILRGVGALHAGGLVHRDLKPENVMVSTRGDVTLVDLGLALGPEASRLTREGVVTGSIPYLAPERIEGRSTAPTADVFALGVVLYELVTGARPFARPSAGEEIAAILAGRFAPLGDRDRRVAPELSDLVQRCLAGDPDARPADANAMLNEVELLLDWAPPSRQRIEVQQILTDQGAYRRARASERVEALLEVAEHAHAAGDVFAAVAAVERALAYRPGDLALVDALEEITTGAAKRSQMRAATAGPRDDRALPGQSEAHRGMEPSRLLRAYDGRSATDGEDPETRGARGDARDARDPRDERDGRDGRGARGGRDARDARDHSATSATPLGRGATPVDSAPNRVRRGPLLGAIAAGVIAVGAGGLWWATRDYGAQTERLGEVVSDAPTEAALVTDVAPPDVLPDASAAPAEPPRSVPGLDQLTPIPEADLGPGPPLSLDEQMRAPGAPIITSAQLGGDPAAALARIEAQLAAQPGDPALRVGQALAWLGNDREAEGLAALEAMTRTHPNLATLFGARGFVAMRLGDLEGAERALDRAIELDPSDASSLRNRGILLHRLGRRAEAYRDLRAALRYAPNDPNALAELAQVYERTGHRHDARPLLERMVQLQPTRPDLWVDLAMSTVEPDASLEAIDRALALAPEHPRAWVERCTTLVRAQRSEAIEVCGRAFELTANPWAQMHRGLAHYHGGDDEAALRDMNAAIATRPRDATMRTNRYLVLLHAGRVDEARADLRVACDLGHDPACQTLAP